MNNWTQRKLYGEIKKSHIKLLEIDCELFGEYQRVLDRILNISSIEKKLSKEDKDTLSEGRKVLIDINWFGWESKQFGK